jgi:hypothetical protein
MYEDVPYKIFFQFQTYPELIPTEHNTQRLQDLEYTLPESNIIVSSFAAALIGPKNDLIQTFYYDEVNPVEEFLKLIFNLALDIKNIVQTTNIPIMMIDDDILDYNLARNCGICGKTFSVDLNKVRDHCHFTKKYRRALCSKCNSLVRLQALPVVIGNGINKYELHFIFKIAQAGNFGKSPTDV